MKRASTSGGVAKAAKASEIHIGTQIDAWVADLERAGCGVVTRGNYRRMVTRLAESHGWRCAADAGTSQIRDFLTKLRAGSHPWQARPGRPAGGCTGKRHNNALTMIRGFFEFCRRNPSEEHPWVQRNPVANIGKVAEHDSDDGSRAFTTGELQKLMATAGTPKRANDRRCSIDRKFFYMALALTGVRFSTAGRMTWGMVDFDAREIRFPRRAVKKGRKTHVVPMCPELVDCLRYWRDRQAAASVSVGPADKVFPEKPSAHSLPRDVERAGIKAETAKGTIGWHSFRKWWMTRVASKAEAPVLHVLAGHASMQTTMKVYVDPDQVLGDNGLGKSVMDAMPHLNGTYPPVAPSPVLQIQGDDLTRGTGEGKLIHPRLPMCYTLEQHDSPNAAPLGRAVEELHASAGRPSPSRDVEELTAAGAGSDGQWSRGESNPRAR